MLEELFEFIVTYIRNDLIMYAIIVPIVIAFITTITLNSIIKPQALCVLEDGVESMRNNWTFEEAFAFADNHGCVPDVLMELESPVPDATTTIGIWRTPSPGTYFTCMVSKEATIHEFVTYFDQEGSMDTTGSIHSEFFPTKKGNFRQVFNNAPIEVLAQRHAEGIAYLKEAFSLQPKAPGRPTDELLQEALINEVKHIKSIKLWPVRAIYWYLIRRHIMNNKTIEQRYKP